jgi:ABC-type bacteriocin/lantibiotic exporter with double-glycine peptidase domain
MGNHSSLIPGLHYSNSYLYPTRSIPTAIALETSKGEPSQGVALGLVLIILAFALNISLQYFQGKSIDRMIMMMHETDISFSGIDKRFGKNRVLTDSAVAIQSGKYILLCGNNGSGKTTLLRIIAGLEIRDSGYVSAGLDSYPRKQCR